MKEKRLRNFSITLLIFNCLSALWGGIGLIYDPSGEFMQIPLYFLQHSPFISYLIPGIILLIANGILSLFIAFITIKRLMYFPFFIIAQGLILAGWLSVQIMMIREFYPPLHIPYYLTALGLVISGGLLTRTQKF
jgi:hypothetical protein